MKIPSAVCIFWVSSLWRGGMLKRNQMAVNFICDTAHVPQHKVLSAMNSKASKNVDRE